MTGLHLQRIYTGLGRDRDAVDVALRLSRLYPDDPEPLAHFKRTRALASQRAAAVPQTAPEITPQVLDVKSPE